MSYDQLIEEILGLLAKGPLRAIPKDDSQDNAMSPEFYKDLAKQVLREIYATGLKDGKEIAGWKK